VKTGSAAGIYCTALAGEKSWGIWRCPGRARPPRGPAGRAAGQERLEIAADPVADCALRARSALAVAASVAVVASNRPGGNG
jgi:hypothetical protein